MSKSKQKVVKNKVQGPVLAGVERTPPAADYLSHHWIDGIELLCLTSPDGRLSQSDVLDIWLPESELEENEVLESGFDSTSAGDQAQYNQKHIEKVNDWFRYLDYRVNAFSQAYPFTLSADKETLIRKENLDVKSELYVLFLLCSCQGYVVGKGNIQSFGFAFERLCAQALRNYLPGNPEVHIFGTSENGRYKGTFFQKVRALAEDTRGKLLLEDEYPSTNTGDGGLDLVAWLPMQDENSGLLVVFAQCGCTPQWEKKQSSSGYELWQQRISYVTPACNMVFIPYCFRQTSGGWQLKDMVRSILVDRERLMKLLANSLATFEAEPARALVQRALEERRENY